MKTDTPSRSLAPDRLDLKRAARFSGALLRDLRQRQPVSDAAKLHVDLLGVGGQVSCAEQVAAEAGRLGVDACREYALLADLLDEAATVARKFATQLSAQAA